MLKSLYAAIPLAAFALTGAAQAAGDYPSKPIELVCTTKPGSGAATWCNMMAEGLSKPEHLGVPVNVVFKSGGSNHEPVVYVSGKDADGYTLMHMSASFSGYFNLPHFTKTLDDFNILAKVEQTLYGVSVRCDDPDIKTWEDLVAYAKEHPGELKMGSNKPGSTHHRHQTRLFKSAGVDVGFVPYQGTGGVVKDVVGNHLRIGFAQPGKWNPHIEAGTVCPLLILNEERLETKNWDDVRSVREVGLDYEIPHQWQGFLVKKGTPEDVMEKLSGAIEAVTQSDAYKTYLSTAPEVIPSFEGDRAKLKTDMEKAIDDTRQLMIDNKIIEG